MKPRSPVLGYNHNVRYANRLWHVQTEDSGVQNPHIFTHLFHNGTILATKRLDYDPANEVPAVQKLMQTQHKTMLRELKAGAYDEKIGKYFGEPVVRGATDDSGEIQSGAFPVEKSSPAAAPIPQPVAPPPPMPPPPDEDSTVFDPYVPTAMRQERASRGERVTNDRMPVAAPPPPATPPPPPADAGNNAFQKVRADMGSAPTMLAMPGTSGDEGPRYRDTLSTPPPAQSQPSSQPPVPSAPPSRPSPQTEPQTSPRAPTPPGGVRERVPTPVGAARNPTPSSALPPARSGPPSETEIMAHRPLQPPAISASSPGAAKPPSQVGMARPQPQAGRPQVGRPPSQPAMNRPTPSSGTPQVGRPPSQPGMNRPPIGGGTTRPAPGRPTPPSTPRPGVPPSTVPSASRTSLPAQGAGIGERRRSPSQPSFSKPTAEGVVVARPAVIIGGESSRAPAGRPPSSAPPARWSGDPQPIDAAARPSSDNIFGGDLISEKSLDEVILAYLSEDLNEK